MDGGNLNAARFLAVAGLLLTLMGCFEPHGPTCRHDRLDFVVGGPGDAFLLQDFIGGGGQFLALRRSDDDPPPPP